MSTNKLGTHATTVTMDGDTVIVTYHNTNIVKVSPDKIILDSGGWFTQTTKRRMNQASEQFNLGFRVYQNKGKWFAKLNDRISQFQDGVLELNRG